MICLYYLLILTIGEVTEACKIVYVSILHQSSLGPTLLMQYLYYVHNYGTGISSPKANQGHQL